MAPGRSATSGPARAWTSDPRGDSLPEVFEHIIALALGFPVSCAVVFVLVRVGQIMKVRADSERAAAAQREVSRWADVAVRAVEQTTVKYCKVGGTWDESAAQHAKAVAASLIVFQAGGQEALRWKLACGNTGVQRVIETHIERAVLDLPPRPSASGPAHRHPLTPRDPADSDTACTC